jgi:AmmeMemoRadiSam system protein B
MKKGRSTLRHPVVSGLFYPDQKDELESVIVSYLEGIDTESLYLDIKKQTGIDSPEERMPIALIVPHAGYIFSGKVQAHGYALLEEKSVDTVIIMGPAHQENFRGISVTLDDAYATPIGITRVDVEFSKRLLEGSDLIVQEERAQLSEHAVEVQIPFIKHLFPDAKIVPLLFGNQDLDTAGKLSELINDAMNSIKKRYIVIASSDLSHYHPSAEANSLDRIVIDDIRNMDSASFYANIKSGESEACGSGAILTGIMLAKERGHGAAAILCHMNSGEVSGDRRKVVGYLSAVMY